MSQRGLVAVGLIGCLVVAGVPVHGDVLKVDIGLTNQLVQDGWAAWSGSGSPGASTIVLSGDFDASFTAKLDNPAPDWRDRKDNGVNLSVPDLPRVLQDGVKEENGFRLTLAGLAAGTYYMTTFHHDGGNEKKPSIDVTVTDATGASLVADNLWQTYGDVAHYATATFPIVCDGMADVSIYFLDNNDSGKTSEDYAWLNGFTLQVPEPSSLLLLGLAAPAALLRRNRRRES